MESLLIVCPLTFERNALARAGIPGRILCIGPGEGGVKRLGELIDADSKEKLVVLAGVAGSLDDSWPAGTAFVVDEVIGADKRLRPTWTGDGGQPIAKVATSRDVLSNESAKRDFAKRTGAQLVDQESEPFARLAIEHGWRWGIVRGVSDDASSELPRDIHNWVTDDGRTNVMRAIRSCIRRPRQIALLMALARNSHRAMIAVSDILRTVSR